MRSYNPQQSHHTEYGPTSTTTLSLHPQSLSSTELDAHSIPSLVKVDPSTLTSGVHRRSGSNRQSIAKQRARSESVFDQHDSSHPQEEKVEASHPMEYTKEFDQEKR